ncbi:MAG: response regulator transcription factor [Burkholderiaceae bacterium]|nr:response regulator transcription factor [Burkholderiaceae bacterium]
MADGKIKVLLVDDHAIVRDGIRRVLSTADDIAVTGEAGNAHDTVRLAREQEFDVALIDIDLPGKNGLELLKQLRSEKSDMAVLILSMYAEDVYAVRALKLGASGFLSKSSEAAILVTAVRKVAAGGKYISAAMAENLAGLLGGGASPYESLSNRELEILRLLAKGESLTQIAETLHLNPSTVTTYRSRVLEKTGARNNAQLLRCATENGLVT